MDEQHSFISISPRDRSVNALFVQGSDLTLGIPHQYVDYSIEFAKDTQVTDADLAHIFSWENVINLHLSGGNQLAQRLANNFVNLLKLKQLRRLSIDVQRDSYINFSVNPFLTAPALREATFDGASVTQSEFDIFVQNQYLPPNSKFSCKVVNHNKYQCKKKLFS